MKEEYYEMMLMSTYGTNAQVVKTKLNYWRRYYNIQVPRDCSQPLPTYRNYVIPQYRVSSTYYTVGEIVYKYIGK